MKITIMNNKLVPFEEIADGTIFRDPVENAHYIKIAPVVNENCIVEWNCLRLDDYALDCFNPEYKVYPIDNAELIIP